jgi:hypothetical protein
MSIRLMLPVIVACAPFCGAQPAVPTRPPGPQYVTPYSVPNSLHDVVVAMGDRVQKPGQERLALTGTYTDSTGSHGIQITWELPNKTRIDITGGSPKSIVYDGQTTQSNAGSLSAADNDLLEGIADDRPETLLYGPKTSGLTMRLLGSRFRTDGGANKNYTGPYYDIFQSQAPVAGRTDSTRRTKLWYFDTLTGLLVKTEYTIQRNGTTVHVETAYTWAKSGGQAVPGQIVRRENGVDVATVHVSTSQIVGAVTDGIFSKP